MSGVLSMSRPGRWTQAIVGVIAALALQLTTAFPAQADTFDDVIKVMKVIDQVAPGVLPFNANDLQSYHDLIIGCSEAGSTDDLLNCIDAASATKAAQDAGVPSWLPQLINVYFDIEHHDYWGLVADAGEAVACAAAELMTGVDVCGAIEAIADAAKDIANAASTAADAVEEFFSDLGADLEDLGTDIYCFFASCGGSPPPPTAIDTANGFCASRGGLKSLSSHSGAVDDVDLICNDGTACQFKPGKPPACSTPAQKAAAESQRRAQNAVDFATQPGQWASAFDAKWVPQCADDTCRLGLKVVKQGILDLAQQRHAADPDYTWNQMIFDLNKADKQAQQIVSDSQATNANAPGAWAAGFDARWRPQCPDDQCRLGLGFVKTGILALAKQRHDANPNYPWSSMTPDLKQADAQAQQLVVEGKARDQAFVAKVNFWGADFDMRWLPQCPDDTCRLGIKFVRTGAVLHVLQEHQANPAAPYQSYVGELKAAEPQAQQLIDEGKKREAAGLAAKKGIGTRPGQPVAPAPGSVRAPPNSR
jgi:hypothetical protein